MLKVQELNELHGRGADTRLVEECKSSIQTIETELKYIEEKRRLVYDYQRDKEELFDREDEFNAQKKRLADKLQQLSDKYNQRKQKHNESLQSLEKELAGRRMEKAVLMKTCRKQRSSSMMRTCVLQFWRTRPNVRHYVLQSKLLMN